MVSCNKFKVSVSTNSCILQNTSVPLIHHTRSLKRSLFFYIILDVILINDLLRLARPIQCASLHAITTTITWSALIGSRQASQAGISNESAPLHTRSHADLSCNKDIYCQLYMKKILLLCYYCFFNLSQPALSILNILTNKKNSKKKLYRNV